MTKFPIVECMLIQSDWELEGTHKTLNSWIFDLECRFYKESRDILSPINKASEIPESQRIYGSVIIRKVDNPNKYVLLIGYDKGKGKCTLVDQYMNGEKTEKSMYANLKYYFFNDETRRDDIMNKNELKEEMNKDIKELHNKVDTIIQDFKDKWDKKISDSEKENKECVQCFYIEDEDWENSLDYEKKLERIVNIFYGGFSNKKKELKIKILKDSYKLTMRRDIIRALVLKFIPINDSISVKVFYDGRKIDEYNTSSEDSYGSYRWISYIGKYLFNAYKVYKINKIEDFIKDSYNIYATVTLRNIVELNSSFKNHCIKSIIKRGKDNNFISVYSILDNEKIIKHGADWIFIINNLIYGIKIREQLLGKDK